MIPHTKRKHLVVFSMAILSLMSRITAALADDTISNADKNTELCSAISVRKGIQADSAERRFSGNVSWYGPGFQGKKTASGAVFDMNKLTAAHLKLPFGTRVQIEDPKTGASIVVVVIDRGPYVKTRVMDVTRESARQLGILLHGVSYVNCLILDDQ